MWVEVIGHRVGTQFFPSSVRAPVIELTLAGLAAGTFLYLLSHPPKAAGSHTTSKPLGNDRSAFVRTHEYYLCKPVEFNSKKK